MDRLDKIIELLESINEKLEAKKSKQKNKKSDTSLLTLGFWEYYSVLYQARWNAIPTRNAMINGMISNICKRIPKEDHEDLIIFFLKQTDAWYLREMHHVRCLQKDCEMLLTRLRSGNVITTSKARTMESASDNLTEAQTYLQNKRNKNAK